MRSRLALSLLYSDDTCLSASVSLATFSSCSSSICACMTFECIHLPVAIPGSSANLYSKMSYNTCGTDLGNVLRQAGNAYQTSSKGCYVLGSALQHETESGKLLGKKVHKTIARRLDVQPPGHLLASTGPLSAQQWKAICDWLCSGLFWAGCIVAETL